jgi:hypothetical protein
MMMEYYPIEVHSKTDAEKYWGISEHLLRVMEHVEPKYRKSGEKIDERNAVVRDMIRLFSQCCMSSLAASEDNIGSIIMSDNVALSNLLLVSILG